MRWAEYEGGWTGLLGMSRGGVCGICMWGVVGQPLGGRLLNRPVNTHLNVCAKPRLLLGQVQDMYVGFIGPDT